MMFRNSLTWLLVIVGAIIYAIGLNAFLIANHLAEGGFVGVSLILYYKTHLPLSVSFLILNIPVLIPGWKVFGHEFILKTGLGVVSVSAFAWVTRDLQVPTHDPLLAALYAGVVTGLGLGLIFRAGATTGGSDIIARLGRHFFGISMGKTLFAIDILVIGLVTVIIGKEIAMYSLVALFVSSRVIDFVIEGVKAGKALMIISDKYEDITAAIHENFERGTTLLQARGGYTGSDKKVIYCVVAREELIGIRRLIHRIDDKAFVVINDIHEVLGEGFTFESPADTNARP